MYSHWSEYSSHRRQEADRSSGQWDDCNDRLYGRPQFHSKYQWNSYHKIWEDGPSSTERRSRTREFNNSSDRQSGRDSLNRDRRSLVTRRRSSPVLDAPVKRRRTCAKDKDTDFRYRHESMEETPNHPKGFKYALSHVDDFKLRRRSPDLRSELRQRDEVAHREQHEDSSDRSFSDCFSDEEYPKRRRKSSLERTRSPDCFTKKYPNPRKRMDSPPTSVRYEDYQNRSSRQSSEGDVAPQSSSVPDKKLSKGFQRFLDVLNRGVNVDALTKIVSQTSTKVSDEYISQSSLVNAAGPGCPERRQKPEHDSSCSGGRRSKLLASPQPHHRSPSPNRTSASDENLPQRSDGRRSQSSKSTSVEKITLTPEDEEKRKQMQDVLKAIGVDLGVDEFGQMTHRIQERLYGKKNDDRVQKVYQERSIRLSARHRSRSSSSSGSTFSPSSLDCYETKDPRRPPRYLTELQESTEYNRRISSSSFQDSKDRMSESQKKMAKPSTVTQTLTHPPPAPPPITSPLLPYAAHFPSVPPPVPLFLPTQFPPGPPPPFPPGPPPSFLPRPPHPPFPPGLPPPFPPGLPPPFTPGLPTPFTPGLPTPFTPGLPTPFTPGLPTPFTPGLPTPFPSGPPPTLFAPRNRSGAFLPSMPPNLLDPNIFQPSQMRPLIPSPTGPSAPPPANALNIPQDQNKNTGYSMTRCLLLVQINQNNKCLAKKKESEEEEKKSKKQNLSS